MEIVLSGCVSYGFIAMGQAYGRPLLVAAGVLFALLVLAARLLPFARFGWLTAVVGIGCGATLLTTPVMAIFGAMLVGIFGALLALWSWRVYRPRLRTAP